MQAVNVWSVQPLNEPHEHVLIIFLHFIIYFYSLPNSAVRVHLKHLLLRSLKRVGTLRRELGLGWMLDGC